MGRHIIIDHNKGNSFKMFFGKFTGDPFKNCCLSSPTSDWDTDSCDPRTPFSRANLITIGHPGHMLDKQNIS